MHIIKNIMHFMLLYNINYNTYMYKLLLYVLLIFVFLPFFNKNLQRQRVIIISSKNSTAIAIIVLLS